MERDFETTDDCPWSLPRSTAGVRDVDTCSTVGEEHPELREALLTWLREPDDEACYDDGLYPELSEGLPGYAILQALPAAEIARLGLKVFSPGGGPGGGYAERVIYRGDTSDLELALRAWNVPLILSTDNNPTYNSSSTKHLF